MNPGVVGVFVPIILFIVVGLVIVIGIYFRSREKQMLIEKGLDAQSMKEFFEHKKDPYVLMKIGIIAFAFGIGLGLGMMLDDYTDKEYWIPFLLFAFTGLGFIAANFIAKKLESKNP